MGKSEEDELRERIDKHGGDKLPQGDFPGPAELDRSCTDVVFLIFFVAFWIGMFVVAGIAFSEGRPNQLWAGYDFTGALCGEGPNVGKNNLYYPLPPMISFAVCVETCPDTVHPIYCAETVVQEGYTCDYNTTLEPTDALSIDELKRVETCLSNFTGLLDPRDRDNKPLSWCFPTYPTAPLKIKGDYARCLPAVFVQLANATKNAVMSAGSEGKKAFLAKSVGNLTSTEFDWSDAKEIYRNPSLALTMMVANVASNWTYIALSAVVALVISLVYIMILRFGAGVIAWCTIFLFEFVLIATAGFLLWKANVLDPSKLPPSLQEYAHAATNSIEYDLKTTEDQQKVVLALGIISAICAVLGALFICVMCTRINFAVKVVKEASKAVHALPALMFFPAITWLLIIMLFVWWVIVLLYLFTAGTFNPESYRYELDSDMRRLVAYHLFGLLWTKSFILAIGDITMAGAVSEWFWTREALKATTLQSFVRTLRYHIGTAAFGSFIIALVEFARMVVRYYTQQMKKLEKKSKIVYAIRCCTECCLACLDRLLKFASRQAYIQTALHGHNFCRGAMTAFQLLLRNALRIAAISVVSHIFIAIGKVFIAVLSALIGAFMIVNATGGGLSDITNADPFSVIIILILAFAIASAFMAIFEVAIDCLFQCICEHGERVPGKTNEKASGMSELMKESEELNTGQPTQESEAAENAKL